jgi:hypothetical protein
MTEIDPLAVRQIATDLIIGHGQDVRPSVIGEWLEDYEDLTEEEAERLTDDIHELIAHATVTVTFPEGMGMGA